MKRIALLFLLVPCLSFGMTKFADGSILLTPEEVKNVETNFDQMQQTILDAVQIIEAQEREIEKSKKDYKCI